MDFLNTNTTLQIDVKETFLNEQRLLKAEVMATYKELLYQLDYFENEPNAANAVTKMHHIKWYLETLLEKIDDVWFNETAGEKIQKYRKQYEGFKIQFNDAKSLAHAGSIGCTAPLTALDKEDKLAKLKKLLPANHEADFEWLTMDKTDIEFKTITDAIYESHFEQYLTSEGATVSLYAYENPGFNIQISSILITCGTHTLYIPFGEGDYWIWNITKYAGYEDAYIYAIFHDVAIDIALQKICKLLHQRFKINFRYTHLTPHAVQIFVDTPATDHTNRVAMRHQYLQFYTGVQARFEGTLNVPSDEFTYCEELYNPLIQVEARYFDTYMQPYGNFTKGQADAATLYNMFLFRLCDEFNVFYERVVPGRNMPGYQCGVLLDLSGENIVEDDALLEICEQAYLPCYDIIAAYQAVENKVRIIDLSSYQGEQVDEKFLEQAQQKMKESFLKLHELAEKRMT